MARSWKGFPPRCSPSRPLGVPGGEGLCPRAPSAIRAHSSPTPTSIRASASTPAARSVTAPRSYSARTRTWQRAAFCAGVSDVDSISRSPTALSAPRRPLGRVQRPCSAVAPRRTMSSGEVMKMVPPPVDRFSSDYRRNVSRRARSRGRTAVLFAGVMLGMSACAAPVTGGGGTSSGPSLPRAVQRPLRAPRPHRPVPPRRVLRPPRRLPTVQRRARLHLAEAKRASSR